MRRKRWIFAPLLAVPLLALLWTGFGHDPNAIQSPLIGKPAPTFALHDLNNHPVSLASLRGRPVVLNFWASWCVECKGDHAALVDAWQRYRSTGVAFVGVSYQDSAGAARSFLRAHGGTWPDLRDPNQQTAIDYGVSGVPETFFIDRRGVIRAKAVGAVDPLILQRNLSVLLKEQA